MIVNPPPTQDSCTTLMEECFPTAMRNYEPRTVLDFICGVLSRNNDTDCYIPEDVYREDCKYIFIENL